MSWRVAEALKAFLSGRSGLEISWVRDFEPPKTDDPSWIRRFAAEGGHAILSGDHRILQHWPDLIAYTESGLTSFFPPPQYDRMGGHSRAALFIIWFPAIVVKVKASERGARWRIPFSWSPDVMRFEALKDPRVDTRDKQQERGIVPAAVLHQFRPGRT